MVWRSADACLGRHRRHGGTRHWRRLGRLLERWPYRWKPGNSTTSQFIYTPGAAWVLWPFAQLPQAAGYYAYVALLVGASAAAAWLASKTYRISFSLALFMALAWGPFTIAMCLGQNSPIALLFVTIAIFAIVREERNLAGLSVGLLLYKPSDAIPLVFLL